MTDLDPERTDIIPGLRPSDTPPLGTPVLEGRHRARRATTPRWAAVAVFGAPTAVVGVTVGLLLGWAPGDRPAPGAASPSHTAPSAVVAPPLPSPSRTDRTTARATTAAPSRSAPSPSPRSSTPSPKPTPSLTLSSSPSRSSSAPPSSTPPDSPASPDLEIPFPTEEPADGE